MKLLNRISYIFDQEPELTLGIVLEALVILVGISVAFGVIGIFIKSYYF